LLATSFIIYQPITIAAEHPRPAAGLELQGATFPEVLNELFGSPGMPGLLNGNQPFEFRVRNAILTPEQAQNFFAPGTPTGMDLAALIAAVQQLPGSEVKIAGFVNGSPFQLKLEAGEVRLRGLALSQTQFNSLLDRLQATPAIREARVQALVDGQRVDIKFENGAREVELRNRIQAQRVGHRDRGRHGRAQVDPAEARLGRVEADQIARVGSTERIRVEHINRPERVERVNRPERPERIERIDRSGRH
jgi:hypothetical protein